MTTQERIYKKLNLHRESVELSAERIELGLIDDVKKSINQIKKNNEIISNQIKLTSQAEKKYEQLHDKLRGDVEDSFDKGLKAMDDAIRYVEKQEATIKEIKKISKELGVEVNEVKEFEKQKNILDKITDDLGENLANLKDIFAD